MPRHAMRVRAAAPRRTHACAARVRAQRARRGRASRVRIRAWRAKCQRCTRDDATTRAFARGEDCAPVLICEPALIVTRRPRAQRAIFATADAFTRYHAHAAAARRCDVESPRVPPRRLSPYCLYAAPRCRRCYYARVLLITMRRRSACRNIRVVKHRIIRYALFCASCPPI